MVKYISVLKDLSIVIGVIFCLVFLLNPNNKQNLANTSIEAIELKEKADYVRQKIKEICRDSAKISNASGKSLNYDYCSKELGQDYLDLLNNSATQH